MSPYSVEGYKLRALIESFFDIPTTDEQKDEIYNLVEEIISAIGNINDEESQYLIREKEVGDIKNYFISVTEKNVDNSLLKMYREYILQRYQSQLPLATTSFAKAATLFTIVTKLSQDKKISLGELFKKVHNITEKMQ